MSQSAIITIQAPRCFECGMEGRPMYRGLVDRFFSVQGRWNVFGCQACGLLWLNPRPAASEIHKLYADYYTHVERIGGSTTRRLRQAVKRSVLASRLGYPRGSQAPRPWSIAGRALGLVPWLAGKAEREVMYLAARPGGRLLDIGAGNGAFMAQMRELGWDVYGVEPDARAAEIAQREHPGRVQVGTIEHAAFEPDFFDAITLCHVVEHVSDPLSMLDCCYTLLRANGTLVVATPNSGGLGHRLLKASWRELDPPRHLFLFDPATLKRCIERAGFRVERVVSSSRNAAQIWATSRQIQRSGRMDAAAAGRRLRLEGIAFRCAETLAQALSHHVLREEVTVIARKPEVGLGGK